MLDARKGGCSITIAHRLSTIRTCDKIVVVDKGVKVRGPNNCSACGQLLSGSAHLPQAHKTNALAHAKPGVPPLNGVTGKQRFKQLSGPPG